MSRLVNTTYHLISNSLTLQRLQRYYAWKRAQAEVHKSILTDPRGYYFCNMVAVLPSAQKMGVGAKLFKTVTDIADKEGMPCYLESSKDVPNIGIYEKMGFRLITKMEFGSDGTVCNVRFSLLSHL